MVLGSSGDMVKLPGMVSQVVGEKAPATSGWRISQVQKHFVAKCGSNAKVNYRTYQPQRPLCRGHDKDSYTVGHIPKTVSRTVSFFLKRMRLSSGL